jgi:hypothetical protein
MTMNYNSAAGTCLLFLGVAILLGTLYAAYGLYVKVVHASTNQTVQKLPNLTVSNTTASTTSSIMSATIEAIVSAMMSQMPVATYANSVIAAVFLAIFASIGYKISMLGIHTLSIDSGKNASK